jgi:hypothetical protein
MIKNILSLVCCVCVAFVPLLSYAETSLVTQVKEGEAAPFKGILLSEDSAAKLFADIKFSQKECDLLLEKELKLTKIKHEGLLNSKTLSCKVETDRLTAMISVRDDRIKFLEKAYNPPAWYESGEFWFALGIIAGVGITTAAGYAIGQAK